MPHMDRRDFIELLGSLGAAGVAGPAFAAVPAARLGKGTYHPGRIQNEYTLFLPGEREALRTPPSVSAIAADGVTAQLGGVTQRLKPNEAIGGWQLLRVATIDGALTAVFEKRATHRGALAFVTDKGVVATIPKQVGQLWNVRPRQIDDRHGIGFARTTHITPHEPDRPGDYILNSAEDPSYENVAALGPEYIGWTLVGNEEGGPQHSLYLDPSGISRQYAATEPFLDIKAHPWSPDKSGQQFDPLAFPAIPIKLLLISQIFEYQPGYSKRTLLGGRLPIANLAVWNPKTQAGYEITMLLPPGADTKPLTRVRYYVPDVAIPSTEQFDPKDPQAPYVLTLVGGNGPPIVKDGDRNFIDNYAGGTADQFYAALSTVSKRWNDFHDSGMQVDIPDQWLCDAAQAGLTLTRCSYHGLEPTYQVGEGAYSDFQPIPGCKPKAEEECPQRAFSVALFPVAHSEFIWAHQLWNHVGDADRYNQFYLDNYVLPNGDFLFNTQTQVEGPLNIGVFLTNSARSYRYAHDRAAFEKRLPILDRMIRLALDRFDYSKAKFPASDPRHGLIWGPPEADLGRPRANKPETYPYYHYQNATWIWRGLTEHARALRQAASEGGPARFNTDAARYEAIAKEMRGLIETSLARTIADSTPAMKQAGITPFWAGDSNRAPTKLQTYENHRFMEDWFMADWGVLALDLGHLKHREIAGQKLLGLGVGNAPSMISNFTAHGTLSVLIRQDDYRPFLLSLYALVCYCSDSGNRYSPEDALIPGGHPFEGVNGAWASVVTSTLQATLGLRWLLCYEENDRDVCHLQKAAPKHWFAKGRSITVKNCPTRFGTVGWSTQAVTDRKWNVTVDLPQGFSGDLVVHLHPNDGQRLRTTTAGRLDGDKVVFDRAALDGARQLRFTVA